MGFSHGTRVAESQVMPLVARLGRYKDIARFVARYGRADFLKHADIEPLETSEP